MGLGERITQADAWLLDKVFQPLADRLPERMNVLDVGMSFQLGSLLFSAASIIAVFIFNGIEDFSSMVFNILIWALCVTFFIGLCRMRALVKPGYANPLRHVLRGVRIVSIPFTIYTMWQANVTAPPFFQAMWFNALSNLVFVIGLYLISCEIRPPQASFKKDIWSRHMEKNGIR
ncbi:hypothetical protein [Acetobacter thailandicus]|uniref:Amino acid permease n=1 Tax=Acetobacter thailandicus TaxID=1502842 RepID=A0ABT3QF57_9PROT|nr:hypothetical protein [Acetobacter thailandicus]MCX2563885.1 hypothetical protein [Acetobacter thailandicus]NHN95044.1 hypothetical protein [Acetobacter thailandicus]